MDVLTICKIRIARVYVEGVAEASSGAGKIGPVATGEAVDTGGIEAVDGPALLDGNPLAAVGPDEVPGVVNSTLFRLRWTVVQGSSPLLPKYLAPEITGVETRLVGQRVSTRLSSSVRWEATSADPC